jgi:hypothetical protein
MTDERLDQILKQALSPEVSKEDIRLRERKRGKNMNKRIKKYIATAACAAATVAIAGIAATRNGTTSNFSADTSDDVQNPFTITVYAKELDDTNYVPLVIGGRQSWALSGNADYGKIYYDILTDFSCQGDNIDTITYRINEGAFDLSEMADDSIIVAEAEYDGAEELRSGNLGVVESTEGDILSVSRFLQEYTVKYDAQTNDTTSISICGEKTSKELLNAIWSDDAGDYEGKAAALDELLEDVRITCTVHFTDGTSASRVITVGGRVMTYEEAGMLGEGEAFDNGSDAQTKDAFIAFSLQNE